MRKSLNTLAVLLFTGLTFANFSYSKNNKNLLIIPQLKRELRIGDPMPVPKEKPCEINSSKKILIKNYCKKEGKERIFQEFYKNCYENPFAIYVVKRNAVYSDYKDKNNFICPDGFIDDIIYPKKGIKSNIKIPKCPGE